MRDCFLPSLALPWTLAAFAICGNNRQIFCFAAMTSQARAERSVTEMDVAQPLLQPGGPDVSDRMGHMSALMRCMLQPRIELNGRVVGCEALRSDKASISPELQSADTVVLDFSACWADLETVWGPTGPPPGAPSRDQLRRYLVKMRPTFPDAQEVADVRLT